MDASYSFAEQIVNITYNDIPGKAIEIAKMDILDTRRVNIINIIKKPHNYFL